MPNSALLLLDLQRDFLDHERGRLPVSASGAEAVIRAANELLALRPRPDVRMVIVTSHFDPDDRLGNLLRRRAAVGDAPGTELDPRILGATGATVLRKSGPSAFSSPGFGAWLEQAGIRDVYVLGVFAEGCVRATVRDAIRRGLRVRVVSDAIASSSSWKTRVALWAMRRAGADVVDLAFVRRALA